MKGKLYNKKMSRTLEQEVSKVNRVKGDLNEQDGFECEKCNNKGYIAKIKEKSIVLANCECMKTRKVLKDIKNSGLERQFKEQTFDSFETPEKWQKNLKSLAKSYVKEISDNLGVAKHWFVISGQVGSGKTHICVSIVGELIKLGLSVRYVGYATDLRRLTTLLRSAYMSDERERAEKEFRDLLDIDILYIDDYLKIDSNNNYLFEIINTRYVSDKITIISTEKNYEEQALVDNAVAGRVYEKSKNFNINISKDENKNYRLRSVNKDE